MDYGIFVDAYGGADQMIWRERSQPPPGPGEITIRHTAIGVNFIDVYCRTGLYSFLTPPGIPGMEGAGLVEAVGEGVTLFREGDRVCYTTMSCGSYAHRRNVPAKDCLLIPEGVADEVAAAGCLKGLTAEALLFRTHSVKAGDTLLVHAAAGGMGTFLCQWAHRLGCRVIGTVSTEAKAEQARTNGCDEVVITGDRDWAKEVMDLTQGQGVSAVYDSVGKATLEGSFACLATFGHVVHFGQTSGLLPEIPIQWLAAKSARLSRPSVFHYIRDRARYEDMGTHLFDAVLSGEMNITIGHRFELKDAAEAHRLLESRASTASIILLP